MADFNEKLIFNLEVNSADFARNLKKAVTDATKNLTPTLTVKASDIKLVGKVKALDLIDLTGFAEALKAAVQGAGASLSPTRLAGRAGPSFPGRLTPAAVAPVVAPAALTAKAVPGGNIVGTSFKGISTRELARAVKDAEREANRLAKEFAEATREKVGRISPGPKSEAGTSLAIDAIQKQILAENENVLRRLRESKPSGFGELSRRAAEATREKVGRISPGPARKDLVGRIDEPGIGKLNSSLQTTTKVLSTVNSGAASVSVTLGGIGNFAIASLNKLNPLTLQTRSNISQLSSQAIRFASINFNGIISGLGKVAGAARTAISPIVSLGSALLRSTAILTGSGLLFGGPAFIPVATVRAASAAFEELNTFTKDVALSVVQFSDKIAALQGADRVGFIADKFRQLGDNVKDTSAKFGLSAKDVSAGLFEILSAQVGISSVAERLEALNSASQVAVGGATDVASAFKGLLAINAAFNTSFQESSDKLFAIQRLGIAPVKDLAPQLGRVASIASEAGVSVNELGAAISTITAKGVPLETTFTGLRQVFAELASGGGPSIQKLIAELRSAQGIDISFDINTLRAEGGLKRFLDTLNEIRRLDPGLIGKIFPDTRAISVILPLLGGVNRFSKDLVQITKAQGEAQAAQETVTNTLAGSYDRLKSSISNTVITTADHIANIVGLKGIVDGIISTFNNFEKALRAISFPDLKKFLSDLLTTKEGLTALKDAFTKRFKETLDNIKVIAAAGVGLFFDFGEFAAKAFANAFSNTIISGVSQSISDAAKLAASALPGGDPRVAAEILSRRTAEAGGKNTAQEDFINKVGKSLDGIATRFNLKLSDGAQTLEQRLSGLNASIDAGIIRNNAQELRDILLSEIEGIESFPNINIDPFIKSIQEIKALDIAKSFLGEGPIDFTKLGSELKSKLLEINLGDVRILDASRFIDNTALDVTLKQAGDKVLKEIDVIQNKINNLSPGPHNRDVFLELEASLENAQSRLSKIDKQRIEIDIPPVVFPDKLFEKLDIKNAGNNAASQINAVNIALGEANNIARQTGLTDSLEKRIALLNDMAKILANTAIKLDFAGLLNLDDAGNQLSIGAEELSKKVAKNFETLFQRTFDKSVVEVPGPDLVGIETRQLPKPSIDDAGRKEIKATILFYSKFLSSLQSSQSLSGGQFDTVRKEIDLVISKLKSMFTTVEMIPGVFDKALNLGEGFDTISFLVGDINKVIEQFTNDAKTQLSGEATAARATAEAYKELATAKEKAANAGGGAANGAISSTPNFSTRDQAPLTIDNSVNATYVTPASGWLGRVGDFFRKLAPK